jgi:hypothetical protein
MKKIMSLIVVILVITGSLFGIASFEIMEQDIVPLIQNGVDGPIVSIEINGLVQSRCSIFSVDTSETSPSHTATIYFENLRWVEESTGWESSTIVNSYGEIIVPAWMYCFNNETKIYTLWGKIFLECLENEGQFEIAWPSADFLWISDNTEIEDNFPQYKSIMIVENLEADEVLPIVQFNLKNYPNPFNPSTTISFTLTQESPVKLEIYNSKGQRVKTLINQQIDAGLHEIIWYGKDENDNPIASGMYFYKLTVNSFTRIKKTMLLK